MNIKRFSAPTMRQAIARIRAELGEEAVIVQNVRTDDGVDVVAATDYDERLASLLGQEPRAADVASEDAGGDTLAAAARVLGRAIVFGKGAGAGRDADDDADKRNQPVRLSLYDEDALADLAPARGAGAKAPSGPPPRDRLDDVGAELRSLREMLEGQVSSLVWRDAQRRNPHHAETLRRLLEFGLAPSLCTRIAAAVPFAADADECWSHARAELARLLPENTAGGILDRGGIVALVGPTGVGKTTTVAKLAGAYTLRHGPGSVGLVTTDDYRLGAEEQLQAFGRILDITVARANDSLSLRAAVRSFGSRSLVLIDTEGCGARAPEQSIMLNDLAASERNVRTYVVLAANTQRSSLARTVASYGRELLHGAVVSKLDECGSLGDVLTALVDARLPVACVTDGQEVPHDLHVMTADELIASGERIAADSRDVVEDEVLGLTFGRAVAAAHA